MQVFSPPRVAAMAERRPRCPDTPWRPREGDQARSLSPALPVDRQSAVRWLVRAERQREPPRDGRAGCRQASGGREGPPGVRGEALPCSVGARRPLPPRAPRLSGV
eukprot:3899231-Alexandrium_andersonii.AAC.1